jgi:hypothetical protein
MQVRKEQKMELKNEIKNKTFRKSVKGKKNIFLKRQKHKQKP